MLKNKSWYALVAITLVCTLAILAGCSQNDSSQTPDNAISALPSVTPEYITEWPENEYTELIPKPEYGTMDYVCDYSDTGRYMLVLTDITKEQSGIYVDELKEQGYTEIYSKGNEVSVGTMLQKDNVVLSVAYSDDIFNILITIESDT